MFTALSVADKNEAIMAFIAGLLATVCNAALMSIPFQLYLFTRKRTSRAIALAAFVCYWVTFEFLHYNWDLTWSWLTVGQGFTFYPFYIQYIEFTGVLGVSALALICNALFFETLCRTNEAAQLADFTKEPFPRPVKKTLYIFAGVAALPLVLYPLIMIPGRDVFQPVGQIGVRVLQPNVDPYNKFNVLPEGEQMDEFYNMAVSRPLNGIQLVVLPETAVPRSVEEAKITEHYLLEKYYRFVNQHPQTDILSGLVAIRFYDKKRGDIPPQSASPYVMQTDTKIDTVYYDFYNAAAVFGSDDKRVYKKAKLVPFTERTPFLETMTFLKDYHIDIGGGFGSYGLPDSIHSLILGSGIKIAPIICYESQFGDFVRKVMNDGAQLGCIITNDGWFGRSSGHIQHAYFTVLRAIETRRDFARSANTGRSLFCNNKGHIDENYIGWWEKGVIDKTLNLYDAQTFYMRFGDWIGYLAIAGATGFFILSFVYRSAKSEKQL